MAKNKNKKAFTFNGKNFDTIVMVTNSLNKHGEIRGASKKETKNLRALCPHHKLNKKGKKKPTVSNNGNGLCTCEMCGSSFTTHLYNKDELDKIVGKINNVLSQARYIVASADLGKEAEQFFARTSVEMAQLPKAYSKIKNAVERSENLKKKKKGKDKNYSGSGSENYGGWR
jgi:hypothetical protein